FDTFTLSGFPPNLELTRDLLPNREFPRKQECFFMTELDTDRRRSHPQIRLLPGKRIDWRTVCVSYGAQAVLVLVIVIMGILTPEKMSLKTYKIEMVALKPYKPPPPPRIRIKI